MFDNAFTFSGLSKPVKVSESILAKASLFGANTVNGPSPLSAPTKSAAFKAVTKVEKSLLETAASTIVWAETDIETNKAIIFNYFSLVVYFF